jgi:DNA-binding XRE family transcriptional regulator
MAVITLSRSEVIQDFLFRYLQLSAAKKRRADRLLELLRESKIPAEQQEIARAFEEIVDPSLAGATVAVDPEAGIRPDSKAKVAAYRHHIGKVVRDRRNALRLTQEQLAERSGLPQSHISRIEAGQHTPTWITIERLAKALETEPGKLDFLYES